MDRRREPTSNINDDVVKALVNSNDQMGKEMEYLKNRLKALEMNRQQPAQPSSNSNNGRGDSDVAVMDPSDVAVADDEDGGDANKNDPPIRKIRFHDLSSLNDNNNNSNNNNNNNNNNNAIDNDDDDADDGNNSNGEESSSSSWSEEDPIVFTGCARVFFQARHHRAATQVKSNAMSTTSQDTYLHLSVHKTANDHHLHVSSEEGQWKPPLIDPPIPLKYFYAARVPGGSNSGAALFLKNDSRRLRKYIFRFEFVNLAVRQPPQLYTKFLQSGKAAKRSMLYRKKMKDAFHRMGEEKKENAKENKKRAQDAFAAHLGSLDELLRESDNAAERFVECVNLRNEELDLIADHNARGGNNNNVMGGGMGGRRKRFKPPPPYWGSGYNRPNHYEEDELDDDNESESDVSEEEDELYYDDDNDDETLLDKVQVSTQHILESLFQNIVK